MNTEIPELDSENPDTSIHQSSKRRTGSALAILALVISLAALAVAAWMWWQDEADMSREEQRLLAEIARLESNDSELSLKLRQIRDELDSSAEGDLQAELSALHQRMEADSAQMEDLERTIGDQTALSRSLQAAADSMQGRLLAAEAALAGMSSRELDAGGELDLAEVDYLLRLANERLKLFADPTAADQALEIADMHLAALDNPIYLGVRQDIAVARRELSGLQLPDFLEIANRLDSLQDSIASLPFPDDAAAMAVPDEDSEAGWWEKLKATLSSLVTVRRSTESENERISLEDRDYVRQRLWLQLEIAHLSLMRHDEQAFRSSLDRVQETLVAWFDPDSSEFDSVNREIRELQETRIQVEVPDITAPWSTLRLIRAGSGSASPVQPDIDPAGKPAPDAGEESRG